MGLTFSWLFRFGQHPRNARYEFKLDKVLAGERYPNQRKAIGKAKFTPTGKLLKLIYSAAFVSLLYDIAAGKDSADNMIPSARKMQSGVLSTIVAQLDRLSRVDA